VEGLHFADCHERRISHREFGIRQVVDLNSVYGVSITRDEAETAWSRILDDYLEGVELFDDIIPCLDALADQRLVVLTSGISEWQRRKLGASGIRDRFEAVLTPEETDGYKPDPQVFTNACQIVGATPEKCINVGDILDKDVLAAEEAGLRGIWLNRNGLECSSDCITEITSMSDLPLTIQTLS